MKPDDTRTRRYYLQRAVDAFPHALEAVGKVLHDHDKAKGSVWRALPWETHLRHEKAHLTSAEVMADRGGAFSDMDEDQAHATTRALMRLTRYLDTEV